MLPSLGVIGAGGRLGRCVCALAADSGCAVSLLGTRQGWEIVKRPDVLIDVSHPSAFAEVAAYCRSQGVALVEGVSNLSPADHDELRRLGERVPVVSAPNFAFGHFLQASLLECLAGLLHGRPGAAEFTVQERHPVTKQDRPSATARELARVWAAHSDVPVADVASIRAGLPVSDHDVLLTLAGEAVGIRHSVGDRTAAARGALEAALWVCKQAPGVWTMADVYRASQP